MMESLGNIWHLGIKELRSLWQDKVLMVFVLVAFTLMIYTAGSAGSMELITQVTLISIILTGAALIREREHGTVEHLMVMPLRPFEIMASKVWANGLVVLLVAIGGVFFSTALILFRRHLSV